MYFDELHDMLLVEVEKRMKATGLSRTELARMANMQQGTLSNLLLRKRKLTNSAAEKLSRALKIEVESILPPPLLPRGKAANIPIVSHKTAANQPLISPRTTLALSGITTRAIKHTASLAVGTREEWTRYVAIRPTRRQVKLMPLLLAEGDLIILDRHDQFSRDEARHLRSIYAVTLDDFLRIGRLYIAHGELTLYYETGTTEDVDLTGKHFVVGRVCRILHKPSTILIAPVPSDIATKKKKV